MLPFCCQFCKNGFKGVRVDFGQNIPSLSILNEKNLKISIKKALKTPKKGFKCELCTEKGKTKFFSNHDSLTAHKNNKHINTSGTPKSTKKVQR